MRYRMILSHLQPLREGEGGGSGAGQGSGGGQGADLDAKIAQAVQSLIARNSGNAEATVRMLVEENYGHRERIRELQGQLPAQGAVVLSSEDATRWQAYQQLGALADVQAALKERDTAAGELKTLKRDLELRDVAVAAGYSLDVLRTLAGELAFVVTDEQKDGKAVKVVAVKDGDKETPLDEYAKAKWAAFLPALKPAAAQIAPARGTPRQLAQQRGAGVGQGTQETEQPRRVVRL